MFGGDVPLHILDHYDGIIDHQSRGQGDAEQRERIDGEVKYFDERKCSDERNRDSDRRDDGGSPVQQEEKNDEDDNADGFGQRHQHFSNRVAHNRCRIKSNGVLEAWRKALGQFLEHGLSLPVYL